VFLIADGVMPSNVGRGYVLRRIMRRAMRHAHALGQNDFLLWRLVRIVVEEMHQGYPELDQAVLLAEDVLRAEEKRFQSMLDRGLFLLKEEIERGTGKILPGDVAFKLYDTYGFPLDLTQDILSEHGLMVDLAGFDLCMEEQKRKARESWVGCGKNSEDGLWLEIKDRHGCTEFVGYNHLQIDAMVQEIVSCESCGVLSSAKSGDEVYIVVNQTPFYGESGGQVGDTGTFSSGGATGRICDVKKRAGAGVFIHKIIVESGELHSGDYVTLIVDSERRWLLSCNHTATHILHRALRDVLGESVAQRGSLVSADKIRFDFSFHRQLSDDEKFRVDSIVNELIRCNQKVSTSIMSLEEARSLGACALFGEKYANEVRTVFIGKDDGTCRDGMGGSQTEMKMIGDAYSIELCGGTHVSRTGDLAVFKIISESASSSGVRRVEALIGERALSYLNCQDSALKHLAGVLRVGKEDIAPRIECLIAEKKEIETKLEEIRRQLALNSVNGNCEKEEDEYSIGGYMLLFHVFKGLSQKELMGALDGCRRSIESGVVVMASLISEKILLVVGVSEDLVDYVSAVDIVRLASEVLGGRGGGGRPDFAQAGGVDVEKMNDAKEAVKQFFSDLVETRLPSLTS
jgi:alanyl-tRNA synthetase